MNDDLDTDDAWLDQVTRFFSRVEDQRVASKDGCWEWPGAITASTGYGRVNVGAQQLDTHRYAWTLLRGPIPANREVCHHCDNRRCINVNHLFLGTRSDNMRDARNKGRIAGQKLQAGQVAQIREALAAGATKTSLAQEYGVSRNSIAAIATGRTWAGI